VDIPTGIAIELFLFENRRAGERNSNSDGSRPAVDDG
jgi:hypothetical protein